MLARLSPAEAATLRDEIAAEEKRNAKLREPLLGFIPRVTPRWQRPQHLAPVAALLERARRGERVRALVSAPPRHGKTELLLHAIGWYLDANPYDSVAYVSYGAQFAQGKSRLAQAYALAAGFDAHPDFFTVAEWRNRVFGGVVATGIDGPLTGKGFNLLLLDDPHKDRIEAESPLLRDRVEEWFRGTALTRLEPGGSAIVFQQRWHTDDLIGRLSAAADEGWEYVNLPAITDDTPLWPQRWNLEDLAALRREVGEYNWASQYLGNPQPRGGKVFQRDAARYTAPTLDGARIVLSIDGAGTEGTRSDYTAAVALAVTGTGAEMRGDVLEVWQAQMTPEHSAPELAAFVQRHGGGKLHIEATRDGKSIARALQAIEKDLRIEFVTPIGDKFVRAQPAAAAWNQGRIRVPQHAPWVPIFLTQADKFTGVGSRKDDMVDALTQAWNVAAESKPKRKVSEDYLTY